MNKFGLMIVFLFSLLVSGSLVSGAVSSDYMIEKVEIDGTLSSTFTGRNIEVERGQSIPVDVWVRGFNHVDNVRVEVSLSGERDTVRYTSDPIELDQNSVKRVSLVLELPEDLEASETYTLRLEVFDSHNSLTEEHQLRVKEERNLLNVLDVLFRPSSTVEAGRYLRTVVRVENLGAKDEKDIPVTVSIPQLGVSSRDYIDELTAERNENDDEDATSLSTNEILVQIPKDAKAGEYDVRVDVEFNRGRDVVTAVKKIVVLAEDSQADLTDTLISVDSTSKTLEKGQEGVFRLTFANLGDKRSLYNVEVAGADTWADVTVEPGFLSVGANEASEMLVKITPKQDAALGPKVFTVKINADNKLAKEINMNVDVNEQTGTGFNGAKKTLEVVFAVLVVVLVILALVIAFRKNRNKESGPGVESSSEQTYY